MRAGQREVSRPPASEQPPAALLLLELALDDGLAVGRQEADGPLRVVAQEAAPRGARARQLLAARHLEHVEEARRAELVQQHLLLLGMVRYSSAHT